MPSANFDKKRITVSLTEDQYSTLEKLAKEKGFSKSAILALALEDYSRKEFEQKK
ncbi:MULTISPECIES: ribbon-helix-helix protein, CopG family [Lactococcus]|uniref:ribbon-helix-helix protein, CopG family n=1 Tax=Lactococcus TaxID=1357 RepID=UPI0022E05D90|nr:ribbon-helix-helix protein, CopG family [Lactococcus lactis]